MKITLEKNSVKALQFASAVCAPDGLYSHILISADERIEVFGTNIEQINCATIPGVILEKGKVMLPAKKFLAIARAAGGSIEMETDGAAVKIKSGRVRHKLVCMDAESFPPVEIPQNGWVPVSGALLSGVIKDVDFSIARDDSRYVFNGLFVQQKGEELTAVATDGRRLAMVTRKTANVFPEAGIIVSGGTIREIKRFLSDSQVFMAITENRFCVRDGSTGYCTVGRLIDGTFPDYNQVIPKKLTGRCEVALPEFQKILESLILSEEIRRVYAVFGESPLVVGCSAADLGESTGEVDCVARGEVHTIGLNAAYLLESLATRSGEKLVIEYSGPSSPVKITDPADDGWMSVVMPMK
jgi:DNA polymerase-3 subunit beta